MSSATPTHSRTQQAHRDEVEVLRRHRVADHLQHVPGRAPVAAARRGERVELHPPVVVHEVDRQVHHCPRRRGPPGGDPEGPHPPRPQAEQEQRTEQQHGVELRRHGQPEEHARPPQPRAGPGEHRARGEGYGEQVPVDDGAEDGPRRERDERGVPRTTAHGERGEDDRREEAGEEQDDVPVVEHQRPGLRAAVPAGEPGPDLHEEPGEHGVLERRPLARSGLHVGQPAVGEAAQLVEERDVGVAQPGVAGIAAERLLVARQLGEVAERVGERREQDERTQRGPEPDEPTAMGAGRAADPLGRGGDHGVGVGGMDDGIGRGHGGHAAVPAAVSRGALTRHAGGLRRCRGGHGRLGARGGGRRARRR